MTKYGYGRVSTEDQNLDMQLQYFDAVGVLKMHQLTDKMSGKNTNRPRLQELLSLVRSGDELYIYSLSRLGRSTKDLLEIFEFMEKTGVKVRSCTESIDTSTSIGRMILGVLAAHAQFERETIVERTRAGLSAAKARGVMLGRPRISTTQLESAQALFDVGKSRKEVCTITKIGITALKEYIKSGDLQEKRSATEQISEGVTA